MTRYVTRSPILAFVICMFGFARIAEAGPQLLCHPFQVGNAAQLPWGTGPGWNTPSASYDLQRLEGETRALLTPDLPVLARMEIMRRAVIYAARDARVAASLLDGFVARANNPAHARDHLALFDAGYLIETFRQASQVYQWRGLSQAGLDAWQIREAPRGLDGYALVRRALDIAGPNAEIEFAASLMTSGAQAEAHRRRAATAARPGSLLAANLTAVDR